MGLVMRSNLCPMPCGALYAQTALPASEPLASTDAHCTLGCRVLAWAEGGDSKPPHQPPHHAADPASQPHHASASASSRLLPPPLPAAGPPPAEDPGLQKIQNPATQHRRGTPGRVVATHVPIPSDEVSRVGVAGAEAVDSGRRALRICRDMLTMPLVWGYRTIEGRIQLLPWLLWAVVWLGGSPWTFSRGPIGADSR